MIDVTKLREAAEAVAASLAQDLKAMEIQILKDDFGKPTEMWKTAFREYNEQQRSIGGRPLSMNCRSCWFKVLKYHENKVKA